MAELILDPKVYDEKFEFDIQGAFYNFPMGEPRDAEEAVNSLQMSGGALGIIDYNEAAKAEGRPLKPEVCMEKLCFLGFMALIDPPRAAVPGAVAKCKVRAERGGNKNTVLCCVLCCAVRCCVSVLMCIVCVVGLQPSNAFLLPPSSFLLPSFIIPSSFLPSASFHRPRVFAS